MYESLMKSKTIKFESWALAYNFHSFENKTNGIRES